MMLKRLFNHTSETITAAAVVLGGAALMSRILGLLRDRLLTYTFGAGPTLDAYYVAFKVPDLLYNLLILGALSSAFIPIFSEYLAKKDTDGAWNFMNKSISTMGSIFLLLAIACSVFAPWYTHLTAPGFVGAQFNLAVLLTRIMCFSPVLMGLSAAVGGALQSLKKFLLYALAPVLYNVGIIVGILIFVPLFGTVGLALGVLLGALMHLGIQLPALISSGFKPAWSWGWKDKNVREMFMLMGPRTIALAAVQINLVVITALASKLPVGSVSIFTLADNIQSMPEGVIAVSFAVAAFPLMTHFAAEGNPDGVAKTINQTMRTVLTWMLPICILFVVLRTEWVRIILGAGKFDWAATVATADTLALFAIGLFGQAAVHVLARGFYAIKDTRTPATVAIAATVIGLGSALWLMGPLGVRGLGLAASIESIINALVLYALLIRRLGSTYVADTLKTIYKISIAGLVMALLVQGLKEPIGTYVNMQTFFGVLIKAGGASLGGLIGFVAIALLLRVPEMYEILEMFKTRLRGVTKLLPADVTDIDSSH